MAEKRKHTSMSDEMIPAPATGSNKVVAIKHEGGDSMPEDGKLQESDSPKKMRLSPCVPVEIEKSAEEIDDYMKETFEERRQFITNDMPTIPEVKETYPYLFRGKNLLVEFLRIAKVDIDHSIQEYCVKYASAVLALAQTMPGASTVLQEAENAKQENATLRQYWDMVSAICLLPLLHRENLVEMVHEIGEDEEVDPTGKIVPMLVSRGNIFSADQFFLIAEETVLQEFEEFTMAFGSLFASYWVFNMEYPRTLNNTYMFVQRVMLSLPDGSPLPNSCKLVSQKLTKWAKEHRKNRK